MRRIGTWCTLIMLTLAGSAAAAQTAKPSASPTATAPVNVNTASQADLEALPGVGPATAKKIIAGRPYTSTADLAKAGVPQATVTKIASLVTFGAAARMPMPTPAPTAASSSTSTPPTSAAAPRSSGTSARTSASAAGSAVTAQQPPVPGMVWVNLETKVFHRDGDRYYGKTKSGKFMSEADALKAGYREAKTGAAKPSSKP